MKIKLSSIILALVLLLSLVSCDMDIFGAKKCHKIELSQSSVTTDIAANQIITITAKTFDKLGKQRSSEIEWNFDRPEKISVIYSGSDTISFTVNDPGRIVLTVHDVTNKEIKKAVIITAKGELVSILLSNNNITLNQKEEHTLSVSFNPTEATNKNLIWESSDTEIVTVTPSNEIGSEAKISSGKPGKANITVYSSANPSIQAVCRVTVSEIEIPKTEPRYINLNISFADLVSILDTEILKATAYDGFNQEYAGVFTWESSNPEIVSVSSSGASATITARSVGTADIKVSLSSYPNITATCKVSVGRALAGLIIEKVNTPLRRSFSLFSETPPQLTGAYPIGSTVTYKVNYLPTATTEVGVNWSTSSEVISISPNGDYVTILANETGSADLRATSIVNASITSYARLGIYDPVVEPDNNISAIELSPSAVLLKPGQSKDFAAYTMDQKGNEIQADLIWSTSNSNINLTQNGNNLAEVVAVSEGITTITVTSLSNPYVFGKATVYVSMDEDLQVPEILVPSVEQLLMVEGNSYDVSISYLPGPPDVSNVSWTSNDTSVASVGSFGDSVTIVANKVGETTIEAKSDVIDNAAIINVKVVSAAEVISKVSYIELSQQSLDLAPPYRDPQHSVIASSFDSNGNEVVDTYTWYVDKPHIIKGKTYETSSQYLISPLEPGSATITVQSVSNPSIRATCYVNISGSLERLTLSSDNLILSKNGTASITASIYPENTPQNSIEWSFVGDSISLEVDKMNKNKVVVKGIKEGLATVKITSKDNPLISAECDITVLEDELPSEFLPSYIQLSKKQVNIDPPITSPSVLDATVYSDNGSIYPRGVRWEIEDLTIAELSTQDEKRVSIIAKKAGETRIIATSLIDETIKETALLLVSGKVTQIRPEVTTTTIYLNDSKEIKVSLLPTNTIETELIWETEGSTDGTAEGTIDENGEEVEWVTPWVELRPTTFGCLITGIKLGQTTVIVRSKARPEEVYAKIAIIVAEAPKAQATITVSPMPIELSPTSTRIKVTANIKPVGDAIISEDVVFTVDPIYLVDTTMGGSNEIYLMPNGTAGEGTIYASLPSYPWIEAGKARVFVGGQLRSLVAQGQQSVAVNVGETASIAVKYNPENTTQTGIIWTSSNEDVARVNGGTATDAIVTGVKAGTATITAKSTYHSDVFIEFTIVVKSIISEVIFTDQFDNKGLIFSTDTETPLKLAATIFPDIERKLVYKPTGNTFTMATISNIDGTINDVVFTPDPGAAGIYEYNIMFENKIVDVLTINTMFKGVSISSTREVFKKVNKEITLIISNDSGKIDDSQIKWTSSDENVAKVSSAGVVKSVNPGSAIISGELNGGMVLQTYIYVNVDIPESFEQALRATGYLPAGGDTILPSVLNSITTLDLRNCPKSLAVDISGIKALKNLKNLYVSGISLNSNTLDLQNHETLKKVEANNLGIGYLASIPKGIEEFSASDNVISNASHFASKNIKVLNLSNNMITSYPSGMDYAVDVNLSNNIISSISITSKSLKKLNISSNKVNSVTINSHSLIELNLSNNALVYESINLNDNTNLNTPNLEILNLNNNKLGLKRGKECVTCNRIYHAANSSTYSEVEASNSSQPLRRINLSWLPKLREIHLQNNHIRSGLSAAGKSFPFIIYAPNLTMVDVRLNHIGRNYSFGNSTGKITSLTSSSSLSKFGIKIYYDKGGCFYTNHYWQEGRWVGFLKWEKAHDVWHLSHSYMY